MRFRIEHGEENMKLKSLVIFFALIALLVLAPVAVAQQPQQPTPTPTSTPNTWKPPNIIKDADRAAYVIGDPVVFTLTVRNPGSPPTDATWYNVRVTDVIDPVLRIDSASSTMGTATINNVTNTVVVNGGITLPPGALFTITINCTVIGGAGQVVINEATVEYVADDGSPQPPIDTDEPVRIIIEEVPIIPEASTLLLLGGAATGLAGYVGLQIRARRRKER